MKALLENIAGLFKVKTIMTLLLVVTLVILAVSATALGKTVWNRLPEKAQKIAAPVLMLASLLTATAYLVSGSYNPFLYFRF